MIISNEDTIAAISTPTGEGGIAVVRISGNLSLEIADLIFRGSLKPSEADTHTVHFGKIIDPETIAVLDEVLLTVMCAPNSYTSEDVVEISSHGGQLLAQKILELCLQNGARMAQPGEFTRRAFINGKLDLTQAEAVADLISARTEISLESAAKHLEGKLSKLIFNLSEGIKNLLMLLEAYTDFPEDNIVEQDERKISSGLEKIKSEIIWLIESYQEGRIIKTGLKVPIVGKPNVGKSSLFNYLLDENRVIVTEIPGTTRDTVSEMVNIGGLPVELIDTAGIRRAENVVEEEGIRRARQEIKNADLVLALIDLTDEDIINDIISLSEALEDCNFLLIANKADLLQDDMLEARRITLKEYNPVIVSANSGKGIDLLNQKLKEFGINLKKSTALREVVITNVRHRDALKKSLDYLALVEKGMQDNISYEFLAFDLKNALNSLEEIIGRTTSQEILDRIFEQFCIGK